MRSASGRTARCLNSGTAATSITTRSPRAADRLVLVPTTLAPSSATTPVFHRLGGTAVKEVARAQSVGDHVTRPCLLRRTPAVPRPSGAPTKCKDSHGDVPTGGRPPVPALEDVRPTPLAQDPVENTAGDVAHEPKLA